MSVASDGTEGNNYSYSSAISADGRFIAFGSGSDNLVPGDTNGVEDIFVRDRLTGHTTRVSSASDGTQGNKPSGYPWAISANGRYVVFNSDADNLVLGDTNGVGDTFVHDRKRGQTIRVSVASDGSQVGSCCIPVTGDLTTISADGQYVVFNSSSDDLVPGDTNGVSDVFVRDWINGQTARVNLASDGSQANAGGDDSLAISADGRYVAFRSEADNLVPGDTNGVADIFVHDRKTNTTTRVSVATDGTQGNSSSFGPALSADGRFVAFESAANNLVAGDTNGDTDIFVRDRMTGTTKRVSVASDGTPGNGFSGGIFSAISADGRFVAFYSNADNLVPGDTNGVPDIFVRDRNTDTTTRVSVATDGSQANDFVDNRSAISADGRYVVFNSAAGNLVPADSNGARDVFVRDRLLLAGKQADLSVTQTESSDPVAKGSLLSYTVKVRNNGLDAAVAVNLTDLVPLNAQLLSVVPSQGSCYPAPITVCRLGTLASGAHAKVRVNLTANQKGVLRNAVSVNAAPRDLAQDNNRSTISTRVR